MHNVAHPQRKVAEVDLGVWSDCENHFDRTSSCQRLAGRFHAAVAHFGRFLPRLRAVLVGAAPFLRDARSTPPHNRPRLSICAPCAPCAPGRDRRTPLPKLRFAGSGALSARNRQIGRAGRFSRPGSELLAVRNKKLFPELTNHKPAVRPPGGSIAFFAIVIGAAQFTLCIATSTNLFVCRCPPWAFPP